MFSVKEIIVTEGLYDKIKLSGFIESPVFITEGFKIFNDKGIQNAIRTFAKETGIVILTDSDSAGLKIRAFIKQLVKDGTVFDAYVPEIYGKERRKSVGGKEGLLGVEGIPCDIILEAIKKSGAEICGERSEKRAKTPVLKSDFYALGLSGRENSHRLRSELLKELSLPSKMSSNMLISVVNRLLTKEELSELVDKIKKI
jgi:ribonuclease M5